MTNTGTIPAGQSATVNLVITPAEDEVPGTTSFEIVATSPISGQSDSIVDALTVNTVVDLAISADQTTQAAPGGVVDILHTVTNEGNITITEGALSQTGLSQFSGVIYLDQNGDGVLDPTDPVIDNIDDIAGGIAPGDSVQLIYRVQVGPVPGVAETGTISIDTALNSGAATDGDTLDNAVEDQIVVVSGDVTLTKYQAIDPDCDGNPGAFSKERQAVEPNQCIRYRIVAANTGTASVDDVVIKDIVLNLHRLRDLRRGLRRGCHPGDRNARCDRRSADRKQPRRACPRRRCLARVHGPRRSLIADTKDRSPAAPARGGAPSPRDFLRFPKASPAVPFRPHQPPSSPFSSSVCHPAAPAPLPRRPPCPKPATCRCPVLSAPGCLS